MAAFSAPQHDPARSQALADCRSGCDKAGRASSRVICSATPGCQPFLPLVAGLASSFVAGVSGGDLGDMLRAGATAVATAYAFNLAGDLTGNLPGALTANGGDFESGPVTAAVGYVFDEMAHRRMAAGTRIGMATGFGMGAAVGRDGVGTILQNRIKKLPVSRVRDLMAQQH